VKAEIISGRVGDGWLAKKCNETIGNWWGAFCGSQAAGQERQFKSGRTAGNSNPRHLGLCDFVIFIVTNSERNMSRAGYKWKWAGFSTERIVCRALAGTHSRVSIWYQPASHELLLHWSDGLHETTTENFSVRQGKPCWKKWHFKSIIRRGELEGCQLSILSLKFVRAMSFFPWNLSINRCGLTPESYV